MTEINILCSICTDNLEIKSKRCCCIKNNIPIKILDCNHQYHTNCIDIWLNDHNTCPLCRKVVKNISIVDNPYNERYNERNNFIDKIKNNKKHIFYSILYILFISGVITHIITLTSTVNYIHTFNNTNSSNEFSKKKIINNIIFTSVYITLLSILLFLKIYLGNKNCIPAFFVSSIILVLTFSYIFYNVVINNYINDHIKLFNDTNNTNDKKMNEYIITRNLIVLIYDSIVCSIYVLFICYIFEKFKISF